MKLVIIGYSGAGKTTLANALSEALGCQVFHVDEAMYDSIRQREAPAAMAIAEARMEALWNGGWIIDGYREQCVKEAWLREADRIIFLNFGKWTCLGRIAKRQIKEYFARGIRYVLKLIRLARQAKGPKTVDRGEISVSAAAYVFKNIRHLRYSFRIEHSAKFESYYMGIGGRYAEKFTVLRTQREVSQFQAALLKNTGN